MNEISQKFLPIGTIAMLKGGTKRVMITGFCSASADDPNKIWDYTGCPYPEGYITSNQTCLFNHEQIEKIYFVGLQDDPEEKEFKETLIKLLETIKAAPETPRVVNNENEELPIIPLQPKPEIIDSLE